MAIEACIKSCGIISWLTLLLLVITFMIVSLMMSGISFKTESVVHYWSCGDLSLVIHFVREHTINYDNGSMPLR